MFLIFKMIGFELVAEVSPNYYAKISGLTKRDVFQLNLSEISKLG